MGDPRVEDPRSSSTQNIVEPEVPRSKATPTPSSETVCLPSIYKGLLLSFLSGVFYSLCAVLVKSMKNIHPGQLAVYRFIAIFAFSLPQAIKHQENILGPRELRFLLILRGIFGATNLFLNFLAFRYLPLGEAAVIIFSVPVFVTIAARIFLKETCGIIQSITVVITVVGIIFITKLPATLAGNSIDYTMEQIYGLGAAFASLIFSTCRFIVLRKVKSVHHSIIMFNFGWVAILETSILTAFIGNFSIHRCGLQQGLLVLLGVLSYAGMTLLTMALQVEQAGPVSTMRAASDIILAFVWQTFIFQNAPDAFSITGAALVGFSVVLVGLRKWVSSLPSESAAAKHLKFLTV